MERAAVFDHHLDRTALPVAATVIISSGITDAAGRDSIRRTRRELELAIDESELDESPVRAGQQRVFPAALTVIVARDSDDPMDEGGPG
ncbi:MAG TPA: hypothetical protein VJT72_17715 [Pseudonocardiaceae bacterium]|nr:hypothetical protein [Pseudonocardiaceae bacterium]